MKIFDVITFPIKMILYGGIYIYKYTISLVLPSSCRYYPSCSSYMLEAIRIHGIFKGVFMGVIRIGRCKNDYLGGFDPVEDNLKTNLKKIV